MRMFEISSKQNKNGRRKFKMILYRIFPDSCVDETNQIGTLYNRNGITWVREYCEKALGSIKGMSLRCEFTDDDRTEILGHGDTGFVDGEPVYEDAVMIGTFTKGYITEVTDDNGEEITVCIGEGEIDAQCYHNYVAKLEEDINKGIYPSGSIEIMHTEENREIVYKYGYKDLGRIPTEFIHSGYALLGITPADDSAKLIELNEKQHKEELNDMTDVEIKALVSQTVNEMSTHTSEINKMQEECEKKIAEANAAVEALTVEKNELVATVEELKAAIQANKQEREDLDKKWDELYKEAETLRKALAEAQAKERLSELNIAIADFSDSEKEYAKAEIDAFNADPIASEINSVVNKIWEGIGKTAKTNEKAIAEQNAARTNETVEDIFGEMLDDSDASAEDINIF